MKRKLTVTITIDTDNPNAALQEVLKLSEGWMISNVYNTEVPQVSMGSHGVFSPGIVTTPYINCMESTGNKPSTTKIN